MKVGILEINFDQLAEMLKLPKGVRISAVRETDVYERVALKVEGEGLPDRCTVAPGIHLARVNCQYRTTITSLEVTEFDRFA